MGDFARSYSIFEHAIEFSKSANAEDLRCIALTNLAVIELQMHSTKAAQDMVKESLEAVNMLQITHPALVDVCC